MTTLGFIATEAAADEFIAAGVDYIRLWPEWILGSRDSEACKADFAERVAAFERGERDHPGSASCSVEHVVSQGTPVWSTVDDLPYEAMDELLRLGATGLLSDLPGELDRLLEDVAELRFASAADHGVRLERASDRTGLHYASPDGSSCREVVFPLDAPNGIGLSPDGSTLYAAETYTGRVFRWVLSGPGTLDGAQANPAGPGGGHLLAGLPGMQLLDSLAVDSEGWVCVGTLINGGITAVSADGETVEHVPFDDPMVTNICFGGDDLRTAYVTLSATGRLVSMRWPRPGLALAHTA